MNSVFDEGNLLGLNVIDRRNPNNPATVYGVTLQPQQSDERGGYMPPGVWFLLLYSDGQFGEVPCNDVRVVR
jgi:hypothetical protein